MLVKHNNVEASDIESIIEALHAKHAVHIKRGFRINDADVHVASNHLIEEAVELQAAITLGDDRDAQVEEAADTLICLLSTLKFAKIPLAEVTVKAAEKIATSWTTDVTRVTADTVGFTRAGRKKD